MVTEEQPTESDRVDPIVNAIKKEKKDEDETLSSSDKQAGDQGSSSDEDDAMEVAEPLATTRSRRTNAGNLMSKIIQDEDDFYSNVYGGFNDEEDDIDFDDEDEANSDEGEDDVDSDFSMSETDDIAPEHQQVDDEPKKRSTGVYKDPKPKNSSNNSSSLTSGPSSSTPVQSKPKASSSSATPHSPHKSRAERSFRDSTRKKTEETIKNIASGGRRKKKSRNMEAPRRLTQEEMLEEAKITEEENVKSLEVYQRLESERLKKIKQIKKSIPIPYVSYLSTTMPVIGTEKRYTRNFVTFVT